MLNIIHILIALALAGLGLYSLLSGFRTKGPQQTCGAEESCSSCTSACASTQANSELIQISAAEDHHGFADTPACIGTRS